VDAQWQATLIKEVTGPYDDGKLKLEQQYLAGIDANAAKASSAGNLDLTLVWRSERDRFTAEKTVPPEDDPAAPAELKQARAAWRAQMARLEKDRADRTKSVQGRYDQVLAQAQAQLTQKQRIEDALMVKSKREEVVAAWLLPLGAGAAETPSGAALPATPEAPKPAMPAAKVPLGTVAGPKLAKVEAQDTTLVPLAIGSKVWSDRNYEFTQIAKGFEGYQFTQTKNFAGTLHFKVLTDGLVYMACTSRFGGGGSGGAGSEGITEEQLRRKGWHKERNTELKFTDTTYLWWVFTRQCKAGEEFTYRTEKYAAPILLVK
jgi:hypothetical protein